MRSLALASLAVVPLVVLLPARAEIPKPEKFDDTGFVKIFDGKTLAGWKVSAKTGHSGTSGLYRHDDIGGITGLVVSNSTLNNNTAATNGGGFYVDVLDDNANFTSVTVTNNTATNGKGGGGYLKNGNLNGSLQALMGNKDANGVNGKYAGVTYALAATCTLTVPANQQPVVQDNQ